MAGPAQPSDERTAMADDMTDDELERELAHPVADLDPVLLDVAFAAPTEHKSPRVRLASRRVPLPVGMAIAFASLAAAVVQVVWAALGGGWPLTLLGAAALALGAVGMFLGAVGVIRYGLFTEGCGMAKIRAERRRASGFYLVAGIAEAGFLTAVAGFIVFLVLHLV